MSQSPDIELLERLATTVERCSKCRDDRPLVFTLCHDDPLTVGDLRGLLAALKPAQCSAVSVTLIEDLTWVRQRVRNCRGAIESGQVTDKDVRGSLLRVTERLDEIIASLRLTNAAQPSAGSEEPHDLPFHKETMSGLDTLTIRAPAGGARQTLLADLREWQHHAAIDPVAAALIGDAADEIDRLSSVSQPKRVSGCTSQIEEAACLIWDELCPGMVMGDADLPHYEAAAKAVLTLSSTQIETDKANQKLPDNPARTPEWLAGQKRIHDAERPQHAVTEMHKGSEP